jgi:hypothetical protein
MPHMYTMSQYVSEFIIHLLPNFDCCAILPISMLTCVIVTVNLQLVLS